MPRWQLTRHAADDIVQIYLQGLEAFGATQADAYHIALEQLFEFLARYPRAARERHEITPPVRAHPYKAHLIVYEILPDDRILVLRIRHAREDWQDEPA